MSDTEERPAVPMEHGLRVDILDNEGIWNTGKIVDVSRDEEDMVEIKYDGWGDEYNEWIPLSSQRLAPLHMFTMVKKCWAKLTKWPWWPAFVVLRAPTRKSAADALNAESKIYVEFFDSYNEGKRSRCWMQKKNIASFQEGFDERASKNIGKNFPAYVDGTQRAMAGRSPVLFSGNGTLPIEFSSRYAKPLADGKLELADGDEDKWFEAYRIFSAHYRVLYGYDFAKDTTVQAGKHAKGKRANGKASGEAAADDDDDDEVEIIEASAKPVKRGRGRPPKGKYPKKQPPRFADEDGDEDDGTEEKEAVDDDYDDAGHAEKEEEEDDGGDEESESPRGRRSARTTSAKRKSAKEDDDEPRRNTRPRRAKDDEGASQEDDDDDDDEGEDFTHYEYFDDGDDQEDEETGSHREQSVSSRSVSPERRPQHRPTKFNAKAHKRTALTQLLSSTQPQPVLKEKVNASTTTTVAVSRSRRTDVISGSMMKELEAAVTTSASEQANPKTRGGQAESVSKSRRKPMHPHSLSSSPETTPSKVEPASPPVAAASATSSQSDVPSPSLRHWLGFGAADEGLSTSGTARKPWSIQSWLISGFQRKQTSESLTNDA